MKETHTAHMGSINNMAVSATLHCLTGCALGEVAGLVIGTVLGLAVLPTIVLAVVLAFVFGFGLSILPLVRAGMKPLAALSVVVPADTLSIATMELVDNLVMTLMPGAMNAGLVNPIFWLSMPIALTAAFFVALPLNKYLLRRGKGHALSHKHMSGHDPGSETKLLLYLLAGFFAGGLLVSAIATVL